jgi:hypothetical protein
MKFERRIRALEARLIADPVILHFADGSTREICGRGDYLLTLFVGASRGADLIPGQAEQLELIRHAVRADEPGRGHMIELIQVMLAVADVDPTLNPGLDAIG